MDDDSLTLLSGNDISWNVVSGPINAISAGGLATADAVYANNNASVVGHWMGAANTVTLLVLNNQPDNYRSYAGDGLLEGRVADIACRENSGQVRPALAVNHYFALLV